VQLRVRWYAIFPEPINEQCSLATGVIALDPGVRSFLTGFDGDGFVDIAKGDLGRMTRLCHYLEDLQSGSAIQVAIQVMLIIAISVPSNAIFGGRCAGYDRR